jgi:WD40 repeat protein
MGVYTTVQIRKADDGTLLHNLENSTSVINNVNFSADSKTLVAGSHDGTILVWQISNGTFLHQFRVEGTCRAVFSPDSSLIALTFTHNPAIQILRASDGVLLQTLEGHTGVSCGNVAFAPGGALMASGALDGTIRLWGVR